MREHKIIIKNFMDWLSLLSPISLIEKTIKWFSRPIVEVDFEYKLDTINENDFCQLRRDRDTKQLAWFFRICIENKGKTIATNCDVRIEKIERMVGNNFEKIPGFSPALLHWANSESDDPRNLYEKTPEFVDVVHTEEGFKDFFVFVKRKNIGVGNKINWPSGQYRLYLKVVGENIKNHDIIVFINFNGKWNELRMNLEE